MKRILITGAGGFIGRNLAKAYLERGDQVYGVDIIVEGMDELNEYTLFRAIKVQKEDFHAIKENNVQNIDVVYHLGWAGQLGGADLQDFSLQLSNIVMTEKLLTALLDVGIKKFVFCGSISFYKYKRELDEEVNSDVYGLSKMYAGKLAMTILSRNNISGNIALLANTYGVGDYSSKAVNTMIRKFIAKENLTLVDANIPNDWVYIDDTVKGLMSIGEKGKPYKEYYIGHRKILSFEENIKTLKMAMKSDLKLSFGGYYDTTVADYTKVDLEALYQDTQFECQCDLKESLTQTAQWLKKIDKENKGI